MFNETIFWYGLQDACFNAVFNGQSRWPIEIKPQLGTIEKTTSLCNNLKYMWSLLGEMNACTISFTMPILYSFEFPWAIFCMHGFLFTANCCLKETQLYPVAKYANRKQLYKMYNKLKILGRDTRIIQRFETVSFLSDCLPDNLVNGWLPTRL